MSKPKVVVIGIDGGEFRVLRNMIKRGLMPNLSGIIRKGITFGLDTYIKGPGQGWVSFITGKSPEKHGIFYWNLYKKPVGPQVIKSKFLWEVLGEKGVRSCVINMSYTYPPRPFNGYMISGLGSTLSILKGVPITYPKSLMEELRRAVGNYIVSCEYKEGGPDVHMKLIRELILMDKRQTEACLYIMKKYSPDFVVLVLRGADLIQHCYWNLLDREVEEISEPNRPLKPLINLYYQRLDHNIGRIFAEYRDSVKVVVSDHGFGPVKAVVFINHYLAEKGFLKKAYPTEAKGYFLFFNPVVSALKFVYKKVLVNYEIFRKLNRMRKSFQGPDLPIDKDRSIAYSDCLFGVNINTRLLRNPNEVKRVKAEVVELLRNLRDPCTGELVMEKVYLKEDSYAKHLTDAPDIIYEPNEKYFVSHEISLRDNLVFRYMDKKETAFFTGSHREQGILILEGDIKTVKSDGIKITDVSASILSLFGIDPSDSGMSGRVVFKG